MTAATTLPALAAFRELSALTAAHAQAARRRLPPATSLERVAAADGPSPPPPRAAGARRRRGGGGAVGGGAPRVPRSRRSRRVPPRSRARVPEGARPRRRRGGRRGGGGRRQRRPRPSPAPIAAAAGVAPAMMPVARAYPVGGDDVTMAHEAHAAQMAQFGLQPFPTFNTMGAVAQHLGGYPARHHAQPSNPHSVAPQIVQFAQHHGLRNRGHAAAPTPTAYPPMAAPAPFSQAAPAPAQHPFGFGRGLDGTPHPGLARSSRRRPPMTKLDGATVGEHPLGVHERRGPQPAAATRRRRRRDRRDGGGGGGRTGRRRPHSRATWRRQPPTASSSPEAFAGARIDAHHACGRRVPAPLMLLLLREEKCVAL